MFNLKNKNAYRKVGIANIVAIQGYDYNVMCEELDSNYDKSGPIAAQLEDSQVIDYMLQWYQDLDIFYQSDYYDANLLNSLFLGKLIKIRGYKGYFLYSHDSRVGYASLSRLTQIE